MAFAVAWIIPACSVGIDEVTEGFILATVTTFELADSSAADSILVHLAGTIGESSAYSFNRLDTAQTGTLFQIAVWGQYRESSKETYTPVPTPFDTVLVLHSSSPGMHYINVHHLAGILRDSTVVY
jgi:hypothetical protein